MRNWFQKSSLKEVHNKLIYKDLIDRITIDQDVCHGKPSVRGLRYPVETILELLASGMTNDEILEDYEDLELADPSHFRSS